MSTMSADEVADATSETFFGSVPVLSAKPVIAVVTSRCYINRRGNAGMVFLAPFAVPFEVTVVAVLVDVYGT